LTGPGLPGLRIEALIFGSWVGLIEMGVTFLLWQRALRLTNHAARIGQLIFISPFVSLMLISEVLGEQIHLTSVVGLAVIVLGFAITRRTTRRSGLRPRIRKSANPRVR
ncbi:MAG: EamA family transporter, partial [Pseudomonadales bacterium]